MKPLAILLLTAVLCGCAAGPRYAAPELGTPDRYAAEPANALRPGDGATGPGADESWWTALDDALLDTLIERAVTANLDLAIARARVRDARSATVIARSRGLPAVGAGASALNVRPSENGTQIIPPGSGLPLSDEVYDAGFDAAWELDLFGGVRRGVQAARARAAATEEAERALRLTVIAEVARNYVELRGAQRRLAVAERNTRIQQDTLTLVTNRHHTGLAPEIDVTRARAQLEDTRSRVPPFRAAVRVYAHRLAVLTGEPPAVLLPILGDSSPLPDPPDLVPVGLPSDLVWRRSDIRQAERNLAAASADTGMAAAQLYPKFFLTGSAGVQNRTFSNLFESLSRTWRFGPLMSWPLFEGGALRAEVNGARARQDAALAQFRHAVLLALEEVESRLVEYAEEQLRRETLQAAAAAGQRSVALARVVYDKGLDDFLTVLDAERTLALLEDQLAESETAVVVRMIALYKALGGGWQVYEPDTVAAPPEPVCSGLGTGV